MRDEREKAAQGAAAAADRAATLAERIRRNTERYRQTQAQTVGAEEARPRPEAAPSTRSRGVFADLIDEVFGEAFASAVARWWASRLGRKTRSIAAPVIACIAVFAGLAAYPPSYEVGLRAVGSFYHAAVSRPELRIQNVAIIGNSRVADETIARALELGDDDRAALTLDAQAARERIEALGWVEKARVSLRPPQTLEVEVWERAPTMLWRVDGGLKLLDAHNVVVAEPSSRREWPDLPMIVGPGANRALDEALALDRAARLAGMKIVGLTRIGQRRWDMELVGGLRIMLPEDAPFAALERAIALDDRYALFGRDIDWVDLRLPFAPTVRVVAARERLRPVSGALGGTLGQQSL